MTEINIRTLLADYGNLRYLIGKTEEGEIGNYEEMLISMGKKYHIEYNQEEDVQFYSGEDPIDKTYYLECRLLDFLSESIIRMAGGE